MSNSIIYEQISNIVFILKMFLICLCTYFTCIKISQMKIINIKTFLSIILIFVNMFIINIIINNLHNYLIAIITLVFVLSWIYILNTKKTIGYSIIITTISLGINYMLFFVSVILSFLPAIALNTNNDYINLLIITIIYILLLLMTFKIKKLKNGIMFIKNKINNEYFDILILNISIIIVLGSIVINNIYNVDQATLFDNIFLSLIIFSIIMIITIQKTLTMYYKHKQLEKTLKETETELKENKQEIEKLEQENLNFSKTSHSIAHKQKALEHKLEELKMNSEIANELDIENRIKEVSSEYTSKIITPDLTKTEIQNIDDMLGYMKSESDNKNIEFELQINGSIHHMINKFITKEELEILLADHIKDAIIAIEHSDNINRSILVKLGLIEDGYGLLIYDTGIEFEIDTLINLGTKPITTHKDQGGTGMGFLNTFDTLKNHNASLIINEIGKPCKENYTKNIEIRFDNKKEFLLKSYRKQDIQKEKINNNLKIID